MPAAKVLEKHVIGDKATLNLNSVSLSDNTMQRYTTEMSADINEQVLTEVQSSRYGFAIQLDETPHVLNWSWLFQYFCVMLLRIPFEVNYC